MFKKDFSFFSSFTSNRLVFMAEFESGPPRQINPEASAIVDLLNNPTAKANQEALQAFNDAQAKAAELIARGGDRAQWGKALQTELAKPDYARLAQRMEDGGLTRAHAEGIQRQFVATLGEIAGREARADVRDAYDVTPGKRTGNPAEAVASASPFPSSGREAKPQGPLDLMYNGAPMGMTLASTAIARDVSKAKPGDFPLTVDVGGKNFIVRAELRPGTLAPTYFVEDVPAEDMVNRASDTAVAAGPASKPADKPNVRVASPGETTVTVPGVVPPAAPADKPTEEPSPTVDKPKVERLNTPHIDIRYAGGETIPTGSFQTKLEDQIRNTNPAVGTTADVDVDGKNYSVTRVRREQGQITPYFTIEEKN